MRVPRLTGGLRHTLRLSPAIAAGALLQWGPAVTLGAASGPAAAAASDTAQVLERATQALADAIQDIGPTPGPQL